jgi:hypothetical protein
MYKPPKLLYSNSPRRQVTTTIRKDLHKKFLSLSIEIDEPSSKMFDVLLLNLLEGDKLEDFISQVKEYGREKAESI